jgi:hypothetical protein
MVANPHLLWSLAWCQLPSPYFPSPPHPFPPLWPILCYNEDINNFGLLGPEQEGYQERKKFNKKCISGKYKISTHETPREVLDLMIQLRIEWMLTKLPGDHWQPAANLFATHRRVAEKYYTVQGIVLHPMFIKQKEPPPPTHRSTLHPHTPNWNRTI